MSKHNNSRKSYNHSKDSQDLFADDDFSLDSVDNDNIYGKRTGKVYQNKKWKRNSQGFYQYQNQTNQSIDSQKKLKQIKQKLGITTSSQDSSQSSQESSYEQSNDKQQLKNQIKKIYVPHKPAKKPSTQNKRRLSRKSEISLDFSQVQLQQLQSNESSNKNYRKQSQNKNKKQSVKKLSKQLDKLSNKKSQKKIQQSKESLINLRPSFKQVNYNDDLPEVQRKVKSKSKKKSRQASQKKQKMKQRQTESIQNQINAKNKHEQMRHKQRKSTKNIFEQNRQDEQQKRNYKQSKKSKNSKDKQVQKNKKSKGQKDKKQEIQVQRKNRFVDKKERNQKFEVQNQFHISNPIQSTSHSHPIDDYFNNESSIKQKHRKSYQQQQTDLDQTVRQLLGQLQDNNGSSTNELNRAIINLQSQNITKQVGQNEQNEKRRNGFKKNKNNKIVQSSQNNESKKQQSMRQKQNRNKLNLRSKRSKQDQPILTQSLRKSANEYYQNTQNQYIQQQQKKKKYKTQAQIFKGGKRPRQRIFQDIQTNDILNIEKLQNQKNIKQNQKNIKQTHQINQNFKINQLNKISQENSKPSKKFKTNQNKKDIKLTKPINNRFSKIRQYDDSQQQYDQNNIDQAEESNKIKQSKAKLNNNLVKQADKNIKKKDRPQRASPQKNSQKPKQIKKANSFPKQINKKSIQQNDDVQIDENNQNQQERRYPKRNRMRPLNYWCGQKAVYDSGRALLGVQTKLVRQMIGFIQQTFTGQFQSTDAMAQNDHYIEKIILSGKSLMDFKGFDDTFTQLQISYQRNKANSDRYGKYVEVYQNGDLQNLRHTATVLPNTGGFTIQNIGQQSAYLELILTRNILSTLQ